MWLRLGQQRNAQQDCDREQQGRRFHRAASDMVQIVYAHCLWRGISEQVISPLKEHPHDNESSGNGQERASG
jgi:hypothetical protein